MIVRYGMTFPFSGRESATPAPGRETTRRGRAPLLPADLKQRLIDTEVNLYHIVLDGGCTTMDALLSLEDVEIEGDIVSIAGNNSEGGLALDFYRL